MGYSTDVYESWRGKQLQKYEDLWPLVKGYLKGEWSVLDFGIGKAWFYGFLESKGFRFRRVVGVDNDARMVEPKREGIEYVITGEFDTREEFDLLIALDSLHLSSNPERLLSYVKKGGFVMACAPLRFSEKLDFLKKHEVITEAEVGDDEKDCFLFVRTA